MKNKYIIAGIVSLLSFAGVFAATPVVFADPATTKVTCKDGKEVTASRTSNSFTTADYEKACKDHGGYTPPLSTDPSKNTSVQTTPVNEGDTANTSFSFNNKTTGVSIEDLLVEIIKFMSALVGICVVGGIIAGGIVYSTAAGAPAKAQQGVKIITNSIIALVLYFLMFAIINFLIPGGVLR